MLPVNRLLQASTRPYQCTRHGSGYSNVRTLDLPARSVRVDLYQDSLIRTDAPKFAARGT